jgi:thiamine biosynthesis protein ThiS
MKIKLNGKPIETTSQTINDLIDEYNQKRQTLVVEQNMHILDKGDYGTSILNAGDVVEFIRFMGGG